MSEAVTRRPKLMPTPIETDDGHTMTSMRLAFVALVSALLLAGCGGSVVDQTGAPRNLEAAAVAPADAAVYVGVVTDSGSAEWKQVEELLARVPDGDRLLAEVSKSLAGKGLDWENDLEPALGPISAIVLPRGGSEIVGLTKPSLLTKLQSLLHRDDGLATTQLEDGWVAVAEKQATLDAYEHALDGARLADDDEFADAVAGMPPDALATVFVRASGLSAGGWTAYAPKTSVPALPALPIAGFDWLGAALTAKGDGVAFDGTVSMDDPPASYEPTLLQRVPAGVVAAVSFHGDEGAFRAITDNEALAPFLPAVERALGVSVQDVLDLLKGQGVLYVRPGLPIPEVTLAVESDDGTSATETLDRIARKLGREPQSAEVDGVRTHAVAVPPVRITWAAFDGVVLVSTGASALRAFRSDDSKLVDEAAFGQAAEKVGLGDETGGFVYADMQRVAELIDGLAGVADDAVPPELGRNLAAMDWFAANGTTEGGKVRLRGFLSVPER